MEVATFNKRQENYFPIHLLPEVVMRKIFKYIYLECKDVYELEKIFQKLFFSSLEMMEYASRVFGLRIPFRVHSPRQADDCWTYLEYGSLSEFFISTSPSREEIHRYHIKRELEKKYLEMWAFYSRKKESIPSETVYGAIPLNGITGYEVKDCKSREEATQCVLKQARSINLTAEFEDREISLSRYYYIYDFLKRFEGQTITMNKMLLRKDPEFFFKDKVRYFDIVKVCVREKFYIKLPLIEMLYPNLLRDNTTGHLATRDFEFYDAYVFQHLKSSIKSPEWEKYLYLFKKYIEGNSELGKHILERLSKYCTSIGPKRDTTRIQIPDILDALLEHGLEIRQYMKEEGISWRSFVRIFCFGDCLPSDKLTLVDVLLKHGYTKDDITFRTPDEDDMKFIYDTIDKWNIGYYTDNLTKFGFERENIDPPFKIVYSKVY